MYVCMYVCMYIYIYIPCYSVYDHRPQTLQLAALDPKSYTRAAQILIGSQGYTVEGEKMRPGLTGKTALITPCRVSVCHYYIVVMVMLIVIM